LGRLFAQGLPKDCPKKLVLGCFDLLGYNSKTLILQAFWAVLLGNVIQGRVPYCCSCVGKRAIFKPILNDSNPWGATLQGFFNAQNCCPRFSPSVFAAQDLPKKNSCFILK